jgi:hypothetical protein
VDFVVDMRFRSAGESWGQSPAEILATDAGHGAVFVRAAAQGHVQALASLVAELVRWQQRQAKYSSSTSSTSSTCSTSTSPRPNSSDGGLEGNGSVPALLSAAAAAALAAAARNQKLPCVWLLWHRLVVKVAAESGDDAEGGGPAILLRKRVEEALGVSQQADWQTVCDAVTASVALASGVRRRDAAADTAANAASAVAGSSEGSPEHVSSSDDEGAGAGDDDDDGDSGSGMITVFR